MADINDPRIQGLMAKLNSPMGALQQPAPVRPSVNLNVKPPLTFEEFLSREKLDEWPQRITSENLLDLSEEKELLGTKDDIVELLREATPLDPHTLGDLEDRLTTFEKQLKVLADKMVVEPEVGASDQGVIPLSVNKAFLTEMAENDVMQVHPSRKSKKKKDFKDTVMETKKKSVEFCTFPGFRVGELTELPGQMEGPHILNRVTRAQDFNPGFKKFWKKIFQSEASVAMMQDAFWWFFLENFQRKGQVEQGKLFDRIADSFVALFMSINPEVRDKVFQVYADCLAQAVLTTFMEAFPESERHFHDDFKQQLTYTLSEWISGVRPPAGTWRAWDLHRLEPKVMKPKGDANTQAQVAQSALELAVLNKDVKRSLDMDDFVRVVQRLGTETIVTVGATADTSPGDLLPKQTVAAQSSSLTAPSAPGPPPASPSRMATCGFLKRQPLESCQVGPGPELERVLFNLQGRSPLVAHFLHMRQLQTNKQYGKRVRRTQVAKIQTEKGPTYRQLINETISAQDTLSKEYQKVCQATQREISHIERQQLETTRKIDSLQKDIQNCRNSVEIKQMSEKIFGKEFSKSAVPPSRQVTDAKKSSRQSYGFDEDDEY